jgi:hypothetical protein
MQPLYPENARPYKPKDKKNSWVAPEHARDASAMTRDYPRDDYGAPIKDNRGREIKIDKRPTIMVPPRKTYIGTK